MSNDQTDTGWERAAWAAHNISQLVYFRSLSLREKMQAIQGMADVVRRFEEMRANGEFHTLLSGRRADIAPAIQPAREPDAPYASDRRKKDSS
jgi:hypothetical protein